MADPEDTSALVDELRQRALYLSQPFASLLLRTASELARLQRVERTSIIVTEGSGIVAVCPNCEEPRSTKHCARCEEVKPFEAFPRDRYKKHGRSSYCRECWVEIKRESRERDAVSSAR